MRHQLERLIETTQLPHVTIQVVLFSAGVAAGGAITILRFPDGELADVVYLEQLTSMLHTDRPADVVHYHQVMDRLSARAEPPTATTMILRDILNMS